MSGCTPSCELSSTLRPLLTLDKPELPSDFPAAQNRHKLPLTFRTWLWGTRDERCVRPRARCRPGQRGFRAAVDPARCTPAKCGPVPKARRLAAAMLRLPAALTWGRGEVWLVRGHFAATPSNRRTTNHESYTRSGSSGCILRRERVVAVSKSGAEFLAICLHLLAQCWRRQLQACVTRHGGCSRCEGFPDHSSSRI